MKVILTSIFLALSACSSGPAKFSAPASNAPVWDLNVGQWPGANALIHPPDAIGSR